MARSPGAGVLAALDQQRAQTAGHGGEDHVVDGAAERGLDAFQLGEVSAHHAVAALRRAAR